MENVFLKLLNMSITASWLVLAVVMLRFLLKKVPKAVNVVLWAFVGVRLICPFSFESVLSLIPSAETLPNKVMQGPSFDVNTGINFVDNTVNDYIGSHYFEGVTVPTGTGMNVMNILSTLWLIGIIGMILYAVISYVRLHIKVREGVELKDNIYLCDRISSPFILGLFRPRIFLPSSMNEADKEYVIAHEKAHLKRLDYIWKPLGFTLLTVYWFNPVMWIAYILLCRDIELACDEKVIKEMGAENKKPYSEALINCSVSRRTVSACPLAFGETGVKSRIKSVLNYKKPAFWVILIAVVSCIVVAVCFLTNPVSSNGIAEKIVNENGYTITNQEKIEVTLSIPKSSLPESIYSEEGYEFANDEVIAYKDDVTTIFLKQVRFSNEGNDNLYFCFDFSYDTPKDGGKLISPLGVGEKSSFVLYNSFVLYKKDKTMRDQNTVYDDAVQVRGQGDNNLIWFYVSTDVLRQAEGTISFDVYLNQITYLKGKEDKLDRAVSQAIFDINPQPDWSGECKAEGHIIYGVEEDGDNVTVYLCEQFSTFGFKNGYFMEMSGHRVPAVYTFVKNGSGYALLDYEYPQDGERYSDSIKELFPTQYEYRAFNPTEKDYASLWNQCVAYAEEYLDEIGREAEVRAYSEVEHTMLTDVGVAVDVSNRILENKSLSCYDSDIGYYETLENGVRYVYRTAYEKDNNLIVFTKELYGEGENGINQIIEEIKINGQTGDIVSENSYPYELPEAPQTDNTYVSPVYLDYTKAADEVRNEYSVQAIHYPVADGDEAKILVGEVYGSKLANYLDNVSWRKSTAPLEDLASPGSVEFVIDEAYRITIHKRKSGSLFAYAVVKVNSEEKHYHASYDDYEKAVAILHAPESIVTDPNEGFNSYSYISENDSAYISLNPGDKRVFFSISRLSSYLCYGTYSENDEKIMITADDMEHQYTFCKDGDNLIFVADKSSPMPEYKYDGANSTPVVCIPDGAVFEAHGYEKMYIDKIYADIDNDGIKEDCIMGYGPTSGLFTVTFTVYEEGKLEYFNIFNSSVNSLCFETADNGKVRVKGESFSVSNEDDTIIRYFDISIKDGNVVLTSDNEMMAYWGAQGVDSPHAPGKQ